MHYLRMFSGVFGEPDTYGIGVSVEQCVVSLKMTLISSGILGDGIADDARPALGLLE